MSERHCAHSGKIIYDSKGAAMKAAGRQNTRVARPYKFSAYFCEFCSGYHYGRLGKDRKRAGTRFTK